MDIIIASIIGTREEESFATVMSKEKTDARKTAEAVVAVVALTAAVVYCVPAAVPAYVSAASFALMY